MEKQKNVIEFINPTMQETLKREKGRIFPADMSPKTIEAIAHHKNVIKALNKQVEMKVERGGDRSFVCPSCSAMIQYKSTNEKIDGRMQKVYITTKYCPECGQKLTKESATNQI